MIKYLLVELNFYQKTILFDIAYKITKSIYFYCFLTSKVLFYENNFKVIMK